MRYAVDPRGANVLIQSWPHANSGGDQDLEPFWAHELRQLRRLNAATAEADELVQFSQAGIDPAGFHIVCPVGWRKLLAEWTEREPLTWQAPTSQGERALLWRNLARVARGLQTLHAQGRTHRHIDAWSILTENRGAEDFQLIGFEWASRRCPGSVESPPAGPPSALSEHALMCDWRELSRMAGKLLQIEDARLTSLAIPAEQVAAGISAREIALLRDLHAAAYLDEARVASEMDAIASSLEFAADGRPRVLNLCLPLGSNNGLTRAVLAASGSSIPIADIEAQRAFVQSDLGGDVQAIGIRGSNEAEFDLLLRGQTLHYWIRDYVDPSGTSAEWVLGFCERASTILASTSLHQTPLGEFSVCVIAVTDPYSPELRSQRGAWEDLRARIASSQQEDGAEEDFAQALLLSQIVQVLFAASQEYPVEVMSASQTSKMARSGKYSLQVRARRDPDREALSTLLGFNQKLGTRLQEMLLGEGGWANDTWQLIESSEDSDNDEGPTEWQFLRDVAATHGQTFTFVGDQPPPRMRRGFLIPSNASSSSRLFRRQIKAWRALRDQGELLRTLTRPRRAIRQSESAVVDDESFRGLDTAKQAALRDTLGTTPLFLVQGPPGVGKTHLVSELARQVLRQEPSARMLFAAQSHAAVDHVLKGVAKKQSPLGDHDALIVRCRAQDASRQPGKFDVTTQAAGIAEALSRSPLLRSCSARLQREVQKLVDPPSTYAIQTRAWKSWRQVLRPVEALLLRAASLVFSTTNAGALERLVDERVQFDWSVIEEAAKATGNELLNPLLLAPRRLMIGDHRQLPPFDSDRVSTVLGDPSKVARLLSLAERIGGRHLYDADVRELLRSFAHEQDGDAEGLQRLCEQSRRTLLLFESLLSDPARMPGVAAAAPFSAMLDLQHRMHPAIAKVVSHAFYADRLKSSESCIREYASAAAPTRCTDPAWASDLPITWVDLPWVQESSDRSVGERRPGPRNPAEIAALLRVVAAIEPIAASAEAATASLAVLTPYRAQVDAIQMAIDRVDRATRTHLQRFVPAGNGYVHTVDSFQGNEADVVIVSLVRNNHRGSLVGALGFLADERRMNVLFSRARWRLIVVGSWRFLEDVVERHRGTPTEPGFLKGLLEGILAAHQDGQACRRHARLSDLKRHRQ